MKYLYYYAWKNNPKRATLYGRRLRILVRGKMNSVLVEFENGQREVVSGNAIRKAKNERRDLRSRFLNRATQRLQHRGPDRPGQEMGC